MSASEHALDLLRTARQIEGDGYALYSAAAAETKDANAVKMFLSLARDEMEHLGKLEMVYCALTKDKEWPSVERKPSRIAHRVFPAPEEAAGALTPDTRELAALKRGMQAEKDSIAFYQKALEEVVEVLEQPVGARRCHEGLRAHGITHVFVGTVEHELWQGLDKFADQDFFDCVFRDDRAAIFALRLESDGGGGGS